MTRTSVRSSPARRTVRCAVCAVLVVVAGLATAGARPPASAETASEWSDALHQLQPSDPMAYFELAEEIADAARTPEERELARRLFALAGLLDRQHLARSACLALADLVEGEGDEQAFRQLEALASLLGGSLTVAGASSDGDVWSTSRPRAVIALTEAFSHYRRGKGSRALTALREPGAMELLESCDRFLSGGVHRFLEDCKLYRGRLRPNLSSSGRAQMLRLELGLLSGDDRPWSSELLFAEGEPLVEVDPLRLEDTFGYDASRPWYRNGRWVADEDAGR